jgi:hypothetical protein
MANQLAIAALSGTARACTAGPSRRTASKPSMPKADANPREIDVVITPADFDRRIDRNGRPYAWVRGTLTYRKTARIRTVMVQGEAYHLIQHLLGVGTSLKIRGIRETIVDKATGRAGGEIFRARDVLKVFDAEGRELDGATGLPLRQISGHERIGHYRRQHYGPGNSLVKIVWIDDQKVNGGRKAA